MQDCIVVEHEYRDGRLNKAYQALMAKLSEEDKTKLRNEQRQWLVDRDERCSHDPESGQAGYLDAAECRLEMTASRAADMGSRFVAPQPDSAVGQPEGRIKQSETKRMETTAAQPDVVFHCIAVNGKEIILRDQGKTIDYSYGYPGQPPEIALSKPRAEATAYQWDGFGRWISYSVSLRNGGTTYTVFTSVDRMSDEHEMEAGVTAIVDDREVARIICRPPLSSKIEGIDLSPEG